MFLKVYKSRVWILLFMLMPFIGNAQIPGLPAGWAFTLNPTSGTYAIPTNVAFNGVDALAADDWIGAFYMDDGVLECGGAVQWDGTENVAIVIFGNDTLVAPDKNGFSENEPITWKFFRDGEECVKAYDAEGAEFNWMNQTLEAVASFGPCTPPDVTIEIPLYSEYQYVSSPVVTEDMNMLTVLDDVLDGVGFVRNNDNKQVFFSPFPPPGQWINQIGDWNNGDGYYFNNTTATETLIMTGQTVDPATPIDIPAGYRYLSYLPWGEMDALTAFNDLLPDIGFIRTNGNKQIFFSPFPPPGQWVNQIENCVPGDGYYVQVNNAIEDFVYPELPPADNSTSHIQCSSSSEAKSGHFPEPVGGEPNDLWTILLGDLTIDGVVAEDGDELAIFDGETIVGKWTVSGFSSWESTLTAYVNLFTPGNTYVLKFWDQSAGVETEDFEILLDAAGGIGYVGNTFPPAGNPWSYATYLAFTGPTPPEAPVLVSATPDLGTLSIDLVWEAIPEKDALVSMKSRIGHFPEPVGGEPNDLWTILLGDLTIDGVVAEDGDELAIFDGETIVGKWTVSGFSSWESTLTAYVNLFTPGNTYVLKFWDQSAGVETEDFDILLDAAGGIGYVGTTFPPAGNPWSYATYLSFTGAPVTSFNVYYQDGTLIETNVEGFTYNVPGLDCGVEYCFYVTQNVEGGESGASNVECATIGPCCQDVVINNFPAAPADVCFGTPVEISFEAVEILYAESYAYSVDPVEAGSFEGVVFTLDDMYVGDVTITLNAYAFDDCADAMESLTFTVNPLPDVTCPDDMAVCIDAAPFALDGATPGDGVYSGMGVVMGIFDPLVAGVGTFEITYTVEDDNMCVNFCTFNITVNPLPNVTCPGDFAVCCDDAAFALTGASPAGGVYSGAGVSFDGVDYIFTPDCGATGDVVVTYTYADANGCVNSCDFTITVYPLPVVSLEAFEPVCEGSDAFYLFGGTPVGGTYYVDGVEMALFDPVVADSYEVEYMYTDANGCTNSAIGMIVVNPLPVVECPPTYDTVCQGSAYIDFEVVANGEYTNEAGTVVFGFDPLESGFFEFELTVTENGCSASCYFAIIVIPLPVVECPADLAVCIDAAPFALDGATPADGVYSGVGVDMGMFDPAVAGAGTWPITYTFTNLGGCAASCDFNITVNPLPVVECPGDMSMLLADLPYTLQGATPEGGTYSGIGVVDSVFFVEEEGVYEITYTYTNENNCTGDCMFTISVGEGCINPPTADAGADAVICANEVYQLAGAATNYASVMWTTSGDGMFNDATALDAEYTPGNGDLAAGMVELCMAVQPSDVLCDPAMDCMMLSFNELPYVDFVLSANEICLDETLYVTATGPEDGAYPYTITGTFNGEPVEGTMESMTEQLELVAPAPGTYVAVLTGIVDANSCAVELNEEFVVDVNALPWLDYDYSALEICLGETVDVTVTGPEDGAYPFTVDYTVNGNPMQDIIEDSYLEYSFTPEFAGTYEYEILSIMSADGCFADMEAKAIYTLVVNPLPYIGLSLSDTVICLGETVMGTITGPADGFYPYTVVYTINGVIMTDVIDGTPLNIPLTPDAAGLYTLEVVSVVDFKGCMALPVEGVELLVHELPVAECPVIGPLCEGSEYIDFPEVDGGVYTDAEGTVLGFDPEMAGTHNFTLTVTNQFGCVDFCEFEIVVNPLPYIGLSLSETVICLGETVTGTISGPGDGGFYPYTVVYTINGEVMTDMIDGTPLDIPLTPDVAGVYTLEVVSVVDANECVAMEVEGVELTVLPLTEITVQPESVEVEFDQAAEFAVEAVNATAYQWYLNATAIAGATDATYAIAAVGLEDGGDYYCVASGECGDATSETVTLTVLPWTQTVDLLGAVNGFSTYLDLEETDVATIFGDLTAIQFVDFVNPNFTWVPGGLDWSMTEDKGAQVLLGDGGYPTSVDVTGYPTLGSIVNVTYSANGSYLPVWSQDVVLADDVFGPHIEDIFAVFSMDYSGYWYPYYGMFTLDFLVPGSSYMVLLYNDVTFNFDVPAVDAAPGYADIPRNITTWNDAVLTATQHNIVITSDAMSQLEDGDVVAAFNEYNQMTGMVEIANTNEHAMLRTYGDNPFTEETEGFVDGELMTIKVWRNGEEIMAQATFDEDMPNQNVFAKNGVSTITGLKLGVTSINDFTADLVANLYPNPATDLVNISTNFEISNVKVVNYVGQVVFDQDVNQVNFQINTSNYGSGMYFVQLENQDGVVITKRLTVK